MAWDWMSAMTKEPQEPTDAIHFTNRAVLHGHVIYPSHTMRTTRSTHPAQK